MWWFWLRPLISLHLCIFLKIGVTTTICSLCYIFVLVLNFCVTLFCEPKVKKLNVHCIIMLKMQSNSNSLEKSKKKMWIKICEKEENMIKEVTLKNIGFGCTWYASQFRKDVRFWTSCFRPLRMHFFCNLLRCSTQM